MDCFTIDMSQSTKGKTIYGCTTSSSVSNIYILAAKRRVVLFVLISYLSLTFIRLYLHLHVQNLKNNDIISKYMWMRVCSANLYKRLFNYRHQISSQIDRIG